MRLLVNRAHNVWSLTEYHDSNIPPYAILSHTWGADGEEVTYKDLIEGTGKKAVGHKKKVGYRKKAGYKKIEFCSRQAVSDGLQHFWVDTCCIDKSSSTELSEAINSMFCWYQKASKCYVYLSDVSVSGHAVDVQSSSAMWEADFLGCKWFSRGWTLQELIAPASVEFFSCEGDRLGSKESLEKEIHDVTGIPIRALRGEALETFDVEERFSWAEHRETGRQEDKAYSLLGVFNIHMPLIYGEGRENAFVRLRRKVCKSSKQKRDLVEDGFQRDDLDYHNARIRRLSLPDDEDTQDRPLKSGEQAQTAPFSNPWFQQPGEPKASREMLSLSHQNLQDLSPQNSYQSKAGYSSPCSSPKLRRSPSVSSIASIHSEVSEHDSYGNLIKRTVTTTTTIYYSASATDDSMSSGQDCTSPPDDQSFNILPRTHELLGDLRASQSGMSHHVCDCCPKKPKKFDREEELQLHKMEKPYSCLYCSNRFKNPNEAARHQFSLHLRRHSWSCAAISGYEAAFHPSTSPSVQTPSGASSDACGYCGEDFPNHPQPEWQSRLEHLTNIHRFGECNQSKKFFRADHFRQHLKHSHAGRSGKWTNMLESACLKDEPQDLGELQLSSPTVE